MILIFLIFFVICDAELDFYRLDVRKANTFLNNRSKRHNSRRGEEGSMFNHDDTLERECLEEKCSTGEIHEVYENDPNAQFDKKSYSTAKTYLENVDPATRRCDEHLNIEDHESKISRHKCWLPGGKTHYGCKCDLNGHKICERNLLLYETIWNRCDQNCKSSPDCPNLVFAYCCSKDSQKRSCPPKMKNAAGPSHKYIYPVFWSEWSRCTEANGYDCRHCINAEHNNRKCGDNIRRRTVGYFNDRDKHTMRDLEGEYPMPQYEAHVNPAVLDIN